VFFRGRGPRNRSVKKMCQWHIFSVGPANCVGGVALGKNCSGLICLRRLRRKPSGGSLRLGPQIRRGVEFWRWCFMILSILSLLFGGYVDLLEWS
jgi:hypothetical protein